MTSVTPERTELEWTYEPSDFFEATYRFADGEYDVLIEDGRAIVNPQLEKHIQTYVRLGSLANDAPLEQGRDRGRHPTGRRLATDGELQEARRIVGRWILAFAKHL